MSNALLAITSEILDNWLEIFSVLRLANSGSGVRSITAANCDFMFHLLFKKIANLPYLAPRQMRPREFRKGRLG
jgi:hypothetical protein